MSGKTLLTKTVRQIGRSSHLQKLERVKEQIASLNIGAWIEIYSAEKTTQRGKLAAIIAATSKYIFVDNLGRKFAEYQHEHLTQDLLDNKLQFINNGDIFEDQLVKVIRGSR